MNQLAKIEELTPEQISEVNKKSASWAQRGHVYTINKIAIDHKVSAKIGAIRMPVDPSKLAEYDEARKANRAFLKDMKDAILEDTRPLDDYIKSRNEPIKRLESHLAEFDSSLLILKKQAEEAREAQNKAKQDAATLRASLDQERVGYALKFDTMIADAVHDFYTRALEKEGVDEITETMMAIMCANFTIINFTPTAPQRTTDEHWSLWKEIVGTLNPAEYQNKYIAAIKERFANFKEDKKHAKEAIAQAEYERNESATRAKTDAEISVAMANLNAAATPAVELGHRALKRVYKVDMPDTAESMMTIDKAFIALGGYDRMGRIKSLWNIKQQQKAEFIASCKNDDNALDLAGVVFVEAKKL